MTRLRAEFHVCGAPKAMEDTAFMHVCYEGNVPGTLWVTQGCTWQLLRAAAARYGETAGLEWDREFPELALGGLNGACRSALKSFENVDLVVQAFG